MAPHSSTLAWKIPWAEEPGGLQSMGSLRVRHDWVTSLSLFTFMHWRRKWQPTSVFLPGESQGWGSLVGCVYGVAWSRPRLKRLSSSSSSRHSLHLATHSTGLSLWAVCVRRDGSAGGFSQGSRHCKNLYLYHLGENILFVQSLLPWKKYTRESLLQ